MEEDGQARTLPSAAEFVHERLSSNHIRLVKVEDIIDDIPHCTLTTVSRESKPEYVAVSYTWAAPEHARFDRLFGGQFFTGTRTIILNGSSFEVRQNLFDLLEQIAMSPDQLRLWLWIDALCINQNDDDERSEQVNRMGQIYANSVYTLVWLGSAYEDMWKVLSILETMGSQGVDGTRKVLDAGLSGSTFTDDSGNPVVPLPKEELYDVWFEVVYFCNRTWFNRLWTLQEVALAPDVSYLCGPFWITQDTMSVASDVIMETEMLTWLQETIGYETFLPMDSLVPRTVLAKLREILSVPLKDEAEWNLYFKMRFNVTGPLHSAAALLAFIIFQTSEHESTEPRDRVFALLDIVRKAGNDLLIEPDYRKSVAEVYTETMCMILRETGCLTPLLLSSSNTALRSELPSWVPDLSALSTYDLLELKRSEERQDFVWYNASKDIYRGIRVSGNQLQVQFIHYGTVTHVGESYTELTDSTKKLCELLLESRCRAPERSGWANYLRNTILTGLCGTPKSDVEEMRLAFKSYLALIIGSHVQAVRDGDADHAAWNDELKLWSRLAQLDATGTVPDPQMVTGHFDQEGNAYLERLERLSSAFHNIFGNTYDRRRLFLLDNGELGLGNELVEPGDILCIVSDGGRTPVLLRKHDDTSLSHWKWIGEAYVDGIMYGEAVDAMEERGQNWQEAIIV